VIERYDEREVTEGALDKAQPDQGVPDVVCNRQVPRDARHEAFVATLGYTRGKYCAFQGVGRWRGVDWK
jgi:hypothetical protein